MCRSWHSIDFLFYLGDNPPAAPRLLLYRQGEEIQAVEGGQGQGGQEQIEVRESKKDLAIRNQAAGVTY